MTASPDDRTAQVEDTETAPQKAPRKRAATSKKSQEGPSGSEKTARPPAAKKPAGARTPVKPAAAKSATAKAAAPKTAAAKTAASKKAPAKTTPAKAAAEKAAPTADVVVEPLPKAMAGQPGATAASAPTSARTTSAARTAAAKNTAARSAATKTTAAKTTAAKAAAAKSAAAKSAAAKSTARSATAKTTAAKTTAAKTAAAKAAATKAAKAAEAKAAKAEAEKAAAEAAQVEAAKIEAAKVEAAQAEAAEAEAAEAKAATAEEPAVVEPVIEAPALVEPEIIEAEAPVTADAEVVGALVVDEPGEAPTVESVEVVEGISDSDDAASDAAGEPGGVSGSEAISIRGLVKQFGDNRAVDGINLSVPAGSFYGVVGPNGAGKTTTLSIVAGLLRADEGSVVICGIDQAEQPQAAKRLMGVLPDRLRTFDRLTGRQLLYYYGLLRGLTADVIEKRAADLARAFDLGDALSRVVSDYSAGMTKKIMLAGAMIHSPRVLVLDEPFESVDPVSSAVILDILRAYVSHGGTVILSSHGMDLVERVCSRVAIIVSGEVLAEGTIDEVRSGQTLEARFVELAGSSGEVEGLEWLHTFSD